MVGFRKTVTAITIEILLEKQLHACGRSLPTAMGSAARGNSPGSIRSTLNDEIDISAQPG
ncbi:hypothetical protein RSSM_03605 [Rhodopirellula sallentina SM41]|uniref:Uncharacterized protein n=1 Tax=Rhodopirellula sallentina SM41 TaxID=1263870 RepID=M5U0Z2_9BACT|nr:hypothetical protein RSSM_03605 [Rhodopirellula sallentina SM41]